MAKPKNQTKQTQKQETTQLTQLEQEIKQNHVLGKAESTQSKNRFEERQPTLSKNITLSKDKKWLIIRTIRTDIVHVNYMEKILGAGDMQ